MTNSIVCQLPLSMEEMKQFIVDSTNQLVVDYKNSQLKDRALLIYCTNIGIPNIAIDFTGCTDEDISTLVDVYITHKSTINIQCLADLVVHLILYFKGIRVPTEFMGLATTTPTAGTVRQFFSNQERVDHISKLMHVLDSIPLYMFSTNTAFAEVYGEPSTVFPTIDDIHYTGYTFVNLLNHPMFLTLYYVGSIPVDSQTYFKQQFEENLFEGKPLFYFFTTQSNNYLLSLYDGLFDGKLPPGEVFAFNEKVVQELLKGSTNDIPV